jgi:hypothetical protein
MLNSESILRIHDDCTERWHRDGACSAHDDPLARLARAHHRANFELWHQEDEARSPQASDAVIATVKHAIDGLNQQRNDLVEQMDNLLLGEAGAQNQAAPLHSESPGLMVDRLSILALKIYHTAEEAERSSATPEHRQRNRERLDILRQQRTDLAACLDALWLEVLAGDRRFRLYRQMKMYNDPDLNPVLYRRDP